MDNHCLQCESDCKVTDVLSLNLNLAEKYIKNLNENKVWDSYPAFQPPSVDFRVITHQKAFTHEELKELFKDRKNRYIEGPDTALLHWQSARLRKDWMRADEIKKLAFEIWEYELLYRKDANIYEVQQKDVTILTKKKQRLIDLGCLENEEYQWKYVPKKRKNE